MKKSVIATFAAAAIAAACVPLFLGCSAQVGYILKTDENGQSYYSVAAEGFTSFMKGEVVIPETYEGYPVKEIEEQAFSGTAITKVTIPATIEKIGTAAFAYDSNLTEVVFAEDSSLEEISWGSFAYCINLKSFTLPSSIKTVDGMAFYGCDALEQINLPAGLERINREAFNGCISLTSINFPEGLISVGAAAFYSCTSLESIVLPDGMHDVEEPSLDEEGNQLKDKDGNPVTIVTPAVGPIAFFGCSNLKSAVLGEGITAISEGMFAGCVGLETLWLPSTIKEVKGIYNTSSVVYGHAFFGADSLNKVYFAGTEEEWAAVKIDNTVHENVSDNSALINADITFNKSYQK